MKQLLTTGIILKRTDYGEADRILTVLTPDQGKLRLMARGVRKVKSKLAGGIELFSVSHITYIRGKSELGTLISTRLIKHYGSIIQDVDRVQLGYELIKLLDRATEDEPEQAYFALLEQAFAALDDASIEVQLIRTWFQAQLLRLAGHSPNLRSDAVGHELEAGTAYNFDLDSMAFSVSPHGAFQAADIKALRLLFSGNDAGKLAKVAGLADKLPELEPLVRTMLQSHLPHAVH